MLTLQEPKNPEKGADLFEANPDALLLALGKRTKTYLKESHLSARTKNAHAMFVWKKIAKRLRNLTHKGALAVQPATGATSLAPWHRSKWNKNADNNWLNSKTWTNRGCKQT